MNDAATAPPAPPDPVPIQHPFAAKNSSYIPKSASTSPVWKLGFRCRNLRKDQDYKKDGALVFCTNDACKNSAGLPTGHKYEFPVFKKWKSGDSNQIMLIHCRGQHAAELEAIISKAEVSVAKATSTQSDVRNMLTKKSGVVFDEVKQREINKAIVYNLVVHDKLPLSRFNSAGLRRSFDLASDGRFKFVHRNHASRILIEAAAEVLAIPATEAICERTFRRAGEVLTKYRMSLLGSNFESSNGQL